MDLEATVVKRLQKLREWQLEQHERLLKQQQLQRDMLNQRQDCIYKALELSMQELDFNDDIVDANNSIESNVNDEANKKDFVKSQMSNAYIHVLNNREPCVKQNTYNFGNISSEQQEQREEKVHNVNNPENDVKKQIKDKIMSSTETEMKSVLVRPQEEKRIEQFMINGVAPLPCDKKLINHTCIDDIPIPSPKKDFHTLLEERLRDCGTQSPEKFNITSGNKIKKPFLRKGEGLSRFNWNQRSQAATPKTRLRSASFTNSTQSEFKYSKNENKVSKAVRPSKNTPLMKSVAQKQLTLKNVPMPKKKLRSKSESNTSNIHRENCINGIKNVVELNTSDFQSGTQKELEEVRMFELLEEKAENSSFCSTSSAVLAFLQQSTPFKMKNCIHKTENGMLSMKKGTSMTKAPKEESSLKSKQAYKYTPSNNNLPHSIDKRTIDDNQCKSTTIVQDVHEMSATKVNENKKMLLKNQKHDEQNMYNAPNIENDSEVDVSLHVRFSEYNEYKTIGLTDTSSISTDSIIANNFSDEKTWSDSSTVDTSNIETLSIPFEIPQISITNDEVQTMKHMSNFMQCDIPGELNYKAQNYKNMWHNKDTNYDTEAHHVHYKDESEFSDTAYESPDEQNIAHSYSQNNLVLEDNGSSSEKNVPRPTVQTADINLEASLHVNSSGDKIAKEGEHEKKFDTSNDTVFKSELLRNRLLELEQEIAIFRKENSALSLQRKKLQEDYKNLYKDYSEKERKLEESQKQGEDRLQEERKKLAREKAALENRMRDSQQKAQKSKLERQEMQILRQEVEKLRDEMHTKESRWTAAQSRHKCQMRILKMENSKLKQEIERLQSLRKNNVRNKGKFGNSSNTKAIHQINKQIKMQYKEPQKTNDLPSDDDQQLGTLLTKGTSIINNHNIEEKKEHSYNINRSVVHEKLHKPRTTVIDITKKRNLYENLLKEATLDLTEVHEQSVKIEENFNEPRLNSKNKRLESKTNIMTNKYQQLYEESDTHTEHNNINDNVQLHIEKDYMHLMSPIKAYPKTEEKDETTVTQDKSSKVHLETSSSLNESQVTVDNQGVKQIQHTDGSMEYRFPNGNIKMIFPDQSLTRLMYYNGDVRETNKDGKIKYFYASTHTWHTTMPDGLEILEFADGQVEKRSHNGTVEVSFPDGSVRILELDGIEKWSLPDGTLIQILTNGEKILTLPNGQREIHTKTHKRREYPDGTIKLIYLDGTQETRYSNGRIRRKDKDGNLLVDSHQ